MIWAVVRWDRVKLIARELKKIGLTGCTVYPVRGYGEEWHLYEPLIHGGHHKIEVVVEDGEADQVVRKIIEHASTGVEGDGILCVFDLGCVINIRLGQTVKSSGVEESHVST